MIIASSLLAISLFWSAPDEQLSPVALSALRSALDSSAEWTMARKFGSTDRVLRSAGTVDCVAQSGIVWRVTAPFPSSVAMTAQTMTFEDEEGTRVKPLSELPYYAEIRKRTDAFVAGDDKAFEGLFALKSESLPEGGWRLVLKPEQKAMERLFTEIEVTGERLPTNAVLRTSDGGSSVIRFRERGDVR